MNEEPKSIWNKPWQGPKKIFVWFGLLASAIFLAIFCIISLSDKATRTSEVAMTALIIALAVAGFLVAAILFIRWLCCWKNFRRFLFGVACFVTLIALAYAVENWRGRRAWKNFKDEVMAKGEKLEIAEIIPPPVPDDQNFAAAPVLKEMCNEFDLEWRHTHSSVAGFTNSADGFKLTIWREDGQITEIGIGNWIKGMRADLHEWQQYYRTPSKLAGKQMENPDNQFPVPPQPQSPAADVLFALSKFDPVVEELRVASQRPHARFPVHYEDGFNALLPHLARLKGCSQLLTLRATAELAADQNEKALADVKLSFYVMDSVKTEPLLISHLVRIAQVNIILGPVWEGLADHKWTNAQLIALDTELGKMDFLADYQLAMRGERAFAIWTMDYFRRTRDMSILDMVGQLDDEKSAHNNSFEEWAGSVLFRIVPGGWFEQNKAAFGRMHRDFIQPAVNREARMVSPVVARQLEAKMKNRFNHPTPYDLFTGQLLPALTHAGNKFARAQSATDLARVACALERHRLAQGKFPETLEALAPQFMSKVPHDIINGQPLKYRRTDDGQFLLYSVGWNETDDGGSMALNKSGSVDVKQGDWVWRYPAK